MVTEQTRLDALVKVVRILAVIAAGAWVVVEYFDYKHELNKLNVGIAGLKVQSQEIDVTLKQIQLRYADAQAREALASQQADTILKQMAVRRAEDTHTELATRLKITKGPVKGTSRTYIAAFGLKLVNKSGKPVTVSYVVIDYFLRHVADELGKRMADARVLRISAPPHLFDPPAQSQSGWRHAGYDAHIVKETLASIVTLQPPAIRSYRFEVGGGGTGSWAPDEGIDIEYPYYIAGQDGDMVGFSAAICLNAGTPGVKYLHDEQFEHLR